MFAASLWPGLQVHQPVSLGLTQPVWPVGGGAALKMSISAGFHGHLSLAGSFLRYLQCLFWRRKPQASEAAGCGMQCSHLCNSDLQLLGGGCGRGLKVRVPDWYHHVSRRGHIESVLPYLGEGHSEGEKTLGVEIFCNFPRLRLMRVGSGRHRRQPTASCVGDLS